ncbi:MAG: TatD family hydrolase [Candidatus Pacebacteria bacterium]|nr:TatD family hydrolase [Candidatus Paceibacterota bacterium]
MLIDTHAHIDGEEYDKDRSEVIGRAFENGVEKIINVSFDLASAKRAIDLAGQYESIYAAIGCHPGTREESGYVFKKSDYSEIAKMPKVVAIGECGLELKNASDLADQQDIFLEQIDLAREFNLPLIVHCRNAHKQVIDILSKAGSIKGVIHCFSGSWQSAQRYFELGLYISFNGIITYAPDYDKVVRNMPLERLLLETDCPYLSPVPFRSERNEPANLEYVVQRIAEIRGEPAEKIADVTTQNAKNLFGL